MTGVISIHSSHTGRDETAISPGAAGAHFNPLFPYGKRHAARERSAAEQSISIHSSHTGRDPPSCCRLQRITNAFQSTLPIREETRTYAQVEKAWGFQSTLPIREETPPPATRRQENTDFNPLFPYGKRPALVVQHPRHRTISIHSSHTGRDLQGSRPCALQTRHFNPLFPYGKRHRYHGHRDAAGYFNPLFPYGKRPFLVGSDVTAQ